jgi:hypothetical protein
MDSYLVEWLAQGYNKRTAFARHVDYLYLYPQAGDGGPNLIRSNHDLISLGGTCLWSTHTLSSLYKTLATWKPDIAYQVIPNFQPQHTLSLMHHVVPLLAGTTCLHITCNGIRS